MPVTPNSSTGKSGILGWVTALLAAGALTLGAVTFTGTAKFNDNVAATFGTDSDATLLHNNTDLLLTTVTGDVIVTPAGGDLIVRQPGGVAGTDDLVLRHDGTDGNVRALSGSLHLLDNGGASRLNITSGGSLRFSVTAQPNNSTVDLGVSGNGFRGLHLKEDGSSGVLFGNDGDARLYYDEAGDDILKLTSNGNGFEIETTLTITGAVTDGYVSALKLDPGYTAATAQTVTRHNYIDIQDVSVAGAGPAAVTNACVFRFDAAAGTHKATAAGGATTSIGTTSGWILVNFNGTLAYVPAFSTTNP